MRTRGATRDTRSTSNSSFVLGSSSRDETRHTKTKRKAEQRRVTSSSPSPNTDVYVLPHFADNPLGTTLLPVGPAYDTSGKRVDWRCADEDCDHGRCKMSAAERRRSLVKARCLNGIEFGEALASALLAQTGDTSGLEHTSEPANSSTDSAQTSGPGDEPTNRAHDYFDFPVRGWDSPLSSLSPSPVATRPSSPTGHNTKPIKNTNPN